MMLKTQKFLQSWLNSFMYWDLFKVDYNSIDTSSYYMHTYYHHLILYSNPLAYVSLLY